MNFGPSNYSVNDGGFVVRFSGLNRSISEKKLLPGWCKRPNALRAVAPLLMLSACSTPMTAEWGQPKAPDYVALGSSFAAGANIGPAQQGSPERCRRTVNNYPSLLASALGLELDDQSCSGATTEHLLESWDELPAQLDAVKASTRLVTITVGGNDLDYVGRLFRASCLPEGEESSQRNGFGCQTISQTSEDSYEKLERSLIEVVQRIHAQSTNARIVFVQYVVLVPGKLCEKTSLPSGYSSLLRAEGMRLAEITASVANQTGSTLLAVDRMSLNHTACDAMPWSVGTEFSNGKNKGSPWHPNAQGHAAIASALVEILGEPPK